MEERKARRYDAHFAIREIVMVSFGIVLITVCTYIQIPMIVPFTLQTFAVFLLLFVLGGRRTTEAVALYLGMGALGCPVFSGMSGGIEKLLGPTGGYLIGFLAMSLLYWAAEAIFKKKTVPMIVALVLGLLVCYAFGTAWFYAVYVNRGKTLSIGYILSVCVVPFILPDIAKLVVAVLIGFRLRKIPSIKS